MKITNTNIYLFLTMMLLLSCGKGHGEESSDSSLTLSQVASDALISLDFDNPIENSGAKLAEKNWETEYVSGVKGKALRLDGSRERVTLPSNALPSDLSALSLEGWIALETYPIANAAFVNQYHFPDKGFYFGLEPSGKWYFAYASSTGWQTVWAPELFPKGSWNHIGVTVNPESGVTLYLNGQEITRQKLNPDSSIISLPDTPLVFGADIHTPKIGDLFETGVINGIIDEWSINARALTSDEIRARAGNGATAPAVTFKIANSRHAKDPHRPRFHPIPDGQWANEPHGLVQDQDGLYHMFFQKNPNGPYWGGIHWGHIISRDLVSWEERPYVLAPKESYDKVGVWSGNAVSYNNELHLFYTGVDGAKATVAKATLGNFLEKAVKLPSQENPVISGKPEEMSEIRDPFVWQEDGIWKLLIGSGADNKGKVILYESQDMKSWTYKGVAFEAPDTGIFWEMPVLLPLGNDLYGFWITTVEGGPPARGLYWIGHWNGQTFSPLETSPRPQDLFNGLLSPTMTQNEAGRITGIGIIAETRSSKEQFNAGWAHTFSLPREYKLCYESGQEDICQTPSPELEKLRGPAVVDISNAPVSGLPSDIPNLGPRSEWILEADLTHSNNLKFEIYLSDTERILFSYDKLQEKLVADRRNSSVNPEVNKSELISAERVPLVNGKLKLNLFFDHSVVEGFVNDTQSFSFRMYPEKGQNFNHIKWEGEEALIEKLTIYPMKQ